MADHKLQIILAAKDISGTALTKFRGSIGAITKSVFSLRGAIGTLAGSAGIGLLVKSSLDAADAIGKAADVAGIGTGALQEYQHAASLSGVSQELLNNSFLAFNKRLGEARQGTGALTTYLNKNDKAFLELLKSTGSTEQALQLVFRRMGELTNASDKAALAAAAFSRSGVKLTVMTKAGAAGLESMREEARRLGLVIGDDLIRNAEEANDKLGTLGTVLKTQVTAAVVELAPKITEVSTNILTWISNNRELITQDLPKYISDVGKAAAESAKFLAALNRGLNETLGGAVESTRKKYIEDLQAEQTSVLNAINELARSKTPFGIMENSLKRLIARHKELTAQIKVAKDQWIDAALYQYFNDIDSQRSAKKPQRTTVTPQPVATRQPQPPPAATGAPTLPSGRWNPRSDRGRWAPRAGGFLGLAELEADSEKMVEISAETYDTMDAHVTAYYDNLQKQSEKSAQNIEYFADRMSTAFAEFVTTGKFSFKDFSNSIISDLIRIQTKAALTGLFSSIGGATGAGSIFGGLFTANAAGGVYDAGGYKAFAGGGVVDRPAVFPFAGGVGLMGEAGPEAILPLRRSSSGKLGVESSGGSGTTVINNYYNITANDAPSFIELARRTGAVPMLAAENLNANGILRQAILENR